jgi:hypothetical protein
VVLFRFCACAANSVVVAGERYFEYAALAAPTAALERLVESIDLASECLLYTLYLRVIGKIQLFIMDVDDDSGRNVVHGGCNRQIWSLWSVLSPLLSWSLKPLTLHYPLGARAVRATNKSLFGQQHAL